MIVAALADAGRYAALHPRFTQAFEFLRNTGLRALPAGKHAVQGEAIFAIVEACQGRTRAEAQLECHRRYIDIQLVLEGIDQMGWKPLAECVSPATDYDAARDILFSTMRRRAGSPPRPDRSACSFRTTRMRRW